MHSFISNNYISTNFCEKLLDFVWRRVNGRQFSVLLKVYFKMCIFNVFLKMYFVKVYFLKMYFLKVGKSEWVVPMAVWGAIQAVGSELLFVITTSIPLPFQMRNVVTVV